ncbi:MAG: FxsA family protein [Acidiferrobacter sp.]
MRRLLRFAAFLPLIEVVLIVIVWRTIGGWWTLGLLAGGSVLGVGLLRLSPVRTMAGARAELARGENPGPAVMGGLALALAGVLLIVPGFFSDLLAVFLLVGPARRALWPPPGAPEGPPPPPSAQEPLEGQYWREQD